MNGLNLPLLASCLALSTSAACLCTLNAGTEDGGACLANGIACSDSARCCSGTCNGVCRQGFGDSCLGDNDCSSLQCVNAVCACTGNISEGRPGTCATDRDCCWDGGCSVASYQGAQVGLCCRDLAQSCGGTDDCCAHNCVNGTCQCLPGGSNCNGNFFPSGCCSGVCENYICAGGAGEQCTTYKDCGSANCDGGVCGCGIAYVGDTSPQLGPIAGLCSTNADCCSGLQCGTNVSVAGGLATDAGSTCCGAAGTACDQGGGGQGTLCCGTCNNGTCACESPGPNSGCSNSAACCPGGACMPGFGNSLACCQLTAQPCFSADECCTGACSNNTCACVPSGGKCGPAGSFAPLGPAACCSGTCSSAGTCN